MTRKRIMLGAVLVAGSVAAGGTAVAASRVRQDPASERKAEADYTDAHRSAAAVSQAAAEKTAVATRPGRISDTHLENEGGGLRWEIKTDDGARVREVQVDAATGDVVSDHPDD